MEKIKLKKSTNDWILAVNEEQEIFVYEDMHSAIVDIVLKDFYSGKFEGEYELTFELKKL